MAGERAQGSGGRTGVADEGAAPGGPPPPPRDDWDGPTAGIEAARSLRPPQRPPAPAPARPPSSRPEDDWDGPTGGVEASDALRTPRSLPRPAAPAASPDDWDGPTAGIQACDALRAVPTRPAAARAAAPPTTPPRAADAGERDPVPGSRLGGFEVRTRLGEAGIGKVFAGVHAGGGRKVAIRILPAALTRAASVAERFAAEVRLINRLGHPHIVDVYAFGRLPDARYCIVMEYLDGQSLANALRDATVVRLDDGVAILLQLCEALAAAHARGVVHGRVRPGNVWLAPGRPPFAKLMDFGLAALHGQAGPGEADAVPVGTPLYLAPEQCTAGRVDRRTDVYALGIVMYEMFTGTTPFADESAAAVIAGHTTREPAQPSVLANLPAGLEQIILRALRKKPEQRFGTVGELARALKEIRADLPPTRPTLRV
jgi:hypothetical protein